jgi:outer membrane protein TolC
MKRILLTLFMIFPAFLSSSTPLSLEDALRIAEERNPEILSYREKLKEAEGRLMEARSGFFPQLSIGGNYTYLSYVTSFTSKVPIFDPVTGQFIGFEDVTFEFGRHNNYRFNFSISQPLFTWGRIRNSYKIALENLEVVKLSLKGKIEEVKAKVKVAYYNALVAKSMVELTESIYEELLTHYKSVESKYREGLVSDLELMRAEVQLKNVIPQKLQAKSFYKTALENLKLLLGFENSEKISLSDTLSYKPLDLTLDELLLEAERKRIDLKILERQLKILEITEKIEKSGDKPTIFASWIYSYEKPFGFEDKWDGSWTFTLGVEFPFFDGFKTKGRIKASRAKKRELLKLYEYLKEAALLEVRTAYRELKTAEEVLKSQEENVKLAKRTFEMAEKQYREGLISSLDVLDIEVAYRQARFSYLSALKDYNVALSNLILALRGKTLSQVGFEGGVK